MLKLAPSFQQFLCKLHSKASQEKWKEQSGPLNLRSAIHCIWCPFTLIIHSLETIIIGSMSLNLKQIILQICSIPLRFPNENDIRFVFTSIDSCLIHIIYVCFRILVSRTYCVVCLFCFPSSWIVHC